MWVFIAMSAFLAGLVLGRASKEPDKNIGPCPNCGTAMNLEERKCGSCGNILHAHEP